MSDFTDRVDELLRAQDAAALVGLSAEAKDKKERKAVKRALFLLKQRGVSIPDAATGAARPAPGQSLGPATLPVLMAPPDVDDQRTFTLGLAEGAAVTIVEVRFGMPDGLELVQGSASTRGAYLPWARGMCARPERGAPQRVRVDGAMLGRKAREVRRCLEDDRLGGDVDHALAQRLARSASGGPHPAERFAGETARSSVAELASRPYTMAALRHGEPLARIRNQWSQRVGISLQGVDGGGPVRTATAEWAEEWGLERLRETLLDSAAYCHALGDRAAAATLAAAALNDPIGLLQDWVAHLMA